LIAQTLRNPPPHNVSRKEVIHPQLRLGIPCYDLSFIAGFAFLLK
jgi:hypothetical protein